MRTSSADPGPALLASICNETVSPTLAEAGRADRKVTLGRNRRVRLCRH